MSHERSDAIQLEELRRRTMLEEFTFTSAAPGIGGLIARFRDAWNRIATTEQARPVMARQSAFNQAVVDWLSRSTGMNALDAGLIDNDREQTRLNHDAALLAARLRWARPGINHPRQSNSVDDRRLRLAYFSPLPPARSGIADYSAELLPYLSGLADVTVFAAGTASPTAPGADIRPMGEYERRRDEFDLPLYQMGNSAHHEAIYELLLRFPGVVVLHDYFLHHFVRHHTVGRGDWAAYGRELAYSLGRSGRELARAVQSGRAAPPLFDVPLNRRIIDAALGLIVHSRYAADRIHRQRPETVVGVVPAPVEIRHGHSRRAELALPDDAVLFASYGQITAEKQIELALRAFSRLRETQPRVHYLLVGEASPDVDVPALIAGLELDDAVHHIGYMAELASFVDWLHTADIVITLRQPTVGETSAVALRAMAAGKPLIVFDHGWYSELPGDAVIKTPPADEAALIRAMGRMAGSADLRSVMGQAALDYIRVNCLPARVADSYIAFLRQLLAAGIAHG